MTQSIKQRVAGMVDGINKTELTFILNSILADLAALKTAVNSHTHSGVTTGTDSSGAANANTAGTLNTVA